MARYKSTSITVECEGEAWIEDFETDVLVDELKRRKQPIAMKKENEDLTAIYELMQDGRHDDAMLALQRWLWPKWKDEEACENALKAIKMPTAEHKH